MITEKEGFDKIQLMMSEQGYAMTHNYKIRYDKGAYSIILCPHQRNYHAFDIKHMYDTIGVENIITWKMEVDHLSKAIAFTLILNVTEEGE